MSKFCPLESSVTPRDYHLSVDLWLALVYPLNETITLALSDEQLSSQQIVPPSKMKEDPPQATTPFDRLGYLRFRIAWSFGCGFGPWKARVHLWVSSHRSAYSRPALRLEPELFGVLGRMERFLRMNRPPLSRQRYHATKRLMSRQ